MSDRKDLNLNLPEWYQMELQTQKTIQKLSGVHELEFYLNHPDAYVRHQAILRLEQLRHKGAVAPLNKIMDDPIEMPLNREIAAWVLKSTGLLGNNDYYIGNHYLDRFTGDERLRDFYYPSFVEGRTNPEYHFGTSGIDAMLLEETLVIRAESLEEKVELPFSIGGWFKVWYTVKLECLRKGFGELTEKLAAALSNFKHQLMHPEQKRTARIQKQQRDKVRKAKPVQTVNTEEVSAQAQHLQGEKRESILDESVPVAAAAKDCLTLEGGPVAAATTECQTRESVPVTAATAECLTRESVPVAAATTECQTREGRPELAAIHESIAAQAPLPQEIIERLTTRTSAEPENKREPLQAEEIIPQKEMWPFTEKSVQEPADKSPARKENTAAAETIAVNVHQTTPENKTDYYIKPFTLKACQDDKENKKLRVKSKIYVRGDQREISFAAAVKGIALKALKIIMLPFVVLWNQKVVFSILIVCLYLFFTFTPLGRMLFYRRSPELARMNDKAIKTAQGWVTDKVTQLQQMASEYELVRDIQKRMVTETQPKEPAQEPVRYIVTSKTLNLRSEPGTQSDKLLVLEQNMIVEFLNQSRDMEEGKTWLYIQAPNGTAGWSFAGYLKKLEGGKEAYE